MNMERNVKLEIEILKISRLCSRFLDAEFGHFKLLLL